GGSSASVRGSWGLWRSSRLHAIPVASEVFGAMVWGLFALLAPKLPDPWPHACHFFVCPAACCHQCGLIEDKPYALTDGGGLYLEILPTGTKVWRYKFHYNGRRDEITIGSYPAVSLKDARQRYAELLEKIAAGQDRKAGLQIKVSGGSKASGEATFEHYARKWVSPWENAFPWEFPNSFGAYVFFFFIHPSVE